MFSDLETDINSVPVKKDNLVKHTCQKCGGTGQYRGVRFHQQRSDCFACGGKGYFKTSPHARAKAKCARVAKKEKVQAAATAQFAQWITDNEELAAYLVDVMSWNDFARSLFDAAKKYGSLTEKQEAALVRMHAKHVAKQADKAKQAEAGSLELDLSEVFAKFNTALASGLKKPKLRLDGICFSLCTKQGQNFGHLYVTDGSAWGSTYLGKVNPEGRFYPARDCTEDHKTALLEISGDVFAAAVAYGNREGACSCCGRKLTNKLSVELGIGPICRENWGL